MEHAQVAPLAEEQFYNVGLGYEARHEWAQAQFKHAELGHEARRTRAVIIAEQMLANPSASVVKFSGTKADAKGAYRLIENAEVTHEMLLSGHIAETMVQCASGGRVLLIQDTTAASFGGPVRRKGLGPVNDAESTSGFHVHSTLAVVLGATYRRVLGVLNQEVWARSYEKKSREETSAERKKRPRESERWPRAQRVIDAGFKSLGLVPPHIVLVTDREGDIFELFEAAHRLKHSFVIRATYSRPIVTNKEGKKNPPRVYSLDHVRNTPVVATKTVTVSARGANRPAR